MATFKREHAAAGLPTEPDPPVPIPPVHDEVTHP